MKIFVSKYWQINILVFIILECMGVIGISSMCIPDLKEGRIDIISLAYGLGAVALAAFTVQDEKCDAVCDYWQRLCSDAYGNWENCVPGLS